MERPEWDDHLDPDPPVYPAAPIPLHERTWRHPSELGATSNFVPPPAAELHRGVLIAASVVGLMCVIGLALVLLPNDPPVDPAVSAGVSTAASATALTLTSRSEPWAGLECHDAEGEVRVASVIDGSPASDSGLQAGDVIVAVDGVPIGDSAALRERFSGSGIGAAVELTVVRSGDTHSMSLVLASSP